MELIDWLRNAVGLLFPQLSEERKFLLQVLRAADRNAEASEVYLLLQRNEDKLNDTFVQVLQDWANETLQGEGLVAAQNIAKRIFYVSNLIYEYPAGSKASNLEIAITGYEIITRVVTRETYSQAWADTKYNLGNAYYYRQHGDKSDNLEQAISCYEEALLKYNRETHPQDWAYTKYNLGSAYRDRQHGDKAENLEQAISCYEEALLELTRADFPQEWADTKYNLGIAYSDRLSGNIDENREQAISCYEDALLGYNRADFPQKWANTKNNLGIAYYYRILEDISENLEQAISCYQEALLELTRAIYPQKWATTTNNLGIAYYHRQCGDKGENLEQAISCYQEALLERPRETFAQKWADTKYNLGLAYFCRLHGDKGENLELAIRCYEEALRERPRETFPQKWADTKYSLGVAYYYRQHGDKGENLEQAISYYQEALLESNRETYPQKWADTKYNLGVAYSDRLSGDKNENLEQAIRYFEEALLERPRETYPQDWADTKYNIGLVYQTANQLQQAYDNFKPAIDTVEFLQTKMSFNEIKNDFTERYNRVYQRMVEVCLEPEKYTEAIEYVESSKARTLVELLVNTQLQPKNVPQATQQRLSQLQKEYLNEQRRLKSTQQRTSNSELEARKLINSSNAPASSPNATPLFQLREQLDKFIADEITPCDPSFRLSEKVQTISIAAICDILGDRTVLLEWYITSNSFQTFIITRDEQKAIVKKFSQEDLENLETWIEDYLKDYKQDKSNCVRNVETQLNQLAQLLHIDEVISCIPAKYTQLILVPYRYLHLFPLHALPLTHQNSCLLDRFPDGIRYAPSCQLLQLTQQNAVFRSQAESKRLFALQNPTQDLQYSDLEVDAIVGYFQPTDVLAREQATKNAFNQTESLLSTHYVHFSCHAYFNFEQPLLSALILANAEVNTSMQATNYICSPEGRDFDSEKCFTLADIFNLNLPQCKLVTLSACEMGLIDFTNTVYEYIGLPSGFLYAGSRTVVSSLWAVSDFHTAILTIRFYQNLQDTTNYPTVSVALNKAQIWLRDITKSQFIHWLYGLQLGENITENIENYLKDDRPDENPFKNPFYWAAFYAVGK